MDLSSISYSPNDNDMNDHDYNACKLASCVVNAACVQA